MCFFFSTRRRHTRCSRDWSSDVCSSDLVGRWRDLDWEHGYRTVPASHSDSRRMRYPQFEKQGFCTSTGVVESGCKIVVGTRLKRAGMHWTVKGANAIIALRCSKLSGRFQDFWERRSERKQVAA